MRDTLENFSQRWMGSNLTKDGFGKIVKEYQTALPGETLKPQGPTPQQVATNWKKLAGLQGMR